MRDTDTKLAVQPVPAGTTQGCHCAQQVDIWKAVIPTRLRVLWRREEPTCIARVTPNAHG